ncbi:helicase associated domain-containing protein [Arthrobacter flavus]|uniref:Helicase associated domain-containing protein n=1 Tax=Arthrobacter flavus TaxID=95172 RepID=A0ABW4Q7W4_9MICC
MYLRGLTPDNIAQLCRVPAKRVRRVIRSFERTQPESAGKRLVLNDRPALPTAAELPKKAPRPSWDAHLQGVKNFQRRHGRLPRTLSKDPIEQRLAVWVAGQRKQVRKGSLDIGRQQLLRSALGDWIGPPRLQAESTLWEKRLTEVIDFIRSEGHAPHFHYGVDRFENILATWLVTQRGLYRQGTLDPGRRQLLDQQIPGWESARQWNSGISRCTTSPR